MQHKDTTQTKALGVSTMDKVQDILHSEFGHVVNSVHRDPLGLSFSLTFGEDLVQLEDLSIKLDLDTYQIEFLGVVPDCLETTRTVVSVLAKLEIAKPSLMGVSVRPKVYARSISVRLAERTSSNGEFFCNEDFLRNSIRELVVATACTKYIAYFHNLVRVGTNVETALEVVRAQSAGYSRLFAKCNLTLFEEIDKENDQY